MLLILCFSFFFPVSASDAGGCSPESFPEKERRKSRTVRNNHYSLGQGRGQRSGPLEEKLPESSKALRVFCYCNSFSLSPPTLLISPRVPADVFSQLRKRPERVPLVRERAEHVLDEPRAEQGSELIGGSVGNRGLGIED